MTNELDYPFPDIPGRAELVTVAEGISWLRMSLPMSLDHINLYVLDDDAGWWIVDTGMGLRSTQEDWQKLFDGPLKGKPVAGVICTHMHPDHIGQAGWLCEKWRVPLYMSFGEYYSARTMAAMTVDNVDWNAEQHYLRAGVGEEYFSQMRAKFRGFGSFIEPMPGAYARLSEGDVLDIGGREWRVMIGRGHSPEHVCLFNERDEILFAGDQIIPKITSNISVVPTEPQGNPLKDWFASLLRFRDELPLDTLVLPAHNTPFRGVRRRLEYLIEHHDDHLLALEEACLAPRTAVDMLPVLFDRELDASQMNMALGEAIAHLNYLVFAGRLRRTLGEDGVYYYQTLDPHVADRLGSAHHRDPLPLEV